MVGADAAIISCSLSDVSPSLTDCSDMDTTDRGYIDTCYGGGGDGHAREDLDRDRSPSDKLGA